MSPAPRGEKHARALSTASRDPKRLRDDETVLSTMSLDRASSEVADGKRKPLKTRKRDQTQIESDDEEAELSPIEDQSSTELGDEKEDDDATLDDEAWLRRHAGSSKSTRKVARTSHIDSPSKTKKRVRKGAKDPFITSPPGTKARGKRAVDDSDDHEIGDEWTDLNGLRWRMGEDGQLRREAIVLEMRLKYPNMPKDSRHPDAKLKVPVLVEKFLTEEEYDDMRAKKLLGFQEGERQRDIDEAEAKKRERQQREEEERRKRIAQSGRPITTPKKVRNIQALYESPLSKSASPSPLRGVLPTSGTQPRSRTSSLASQRSASFSSSVPHKRLSLSMGNSDALSTSSAPVTPSGPERTSSSMSAPLSSSASASPSRQQKSLRIPLSSPLSSSKANPLQSPSAPGSTIKRVLGSLGDIVARRKREESLLNLLKSESEQRKKRQSPVK